MFKIWRITSFITLIQIVFVVSFSSFPLYNLKEQLMIAIYSSAGVALVMFAIRLIIRSEKYVPEARLAVSLAFVASFASTCLLNYYRYTLEGSQLYMNTTCFAGMMLGFYLALAIKVAKTVSPSSNYIMITLCSLPLGIGMIFGGISLLVSRNRK